VLKDEWTRAADDLFRRTVIVIPVYLTESIPFAQGRDLVERTVASCVREVERPASVCLSADGPGPGEAVAEDLSRVYGVRLVRSDRNRGKLAGVRAGVSHMLEAGGSRECRYVAALDMDGDHFANELLNFLRAAAQVRAVTGRDRTLVLGRRVSRHRPMGFVRGELEELADRVLLDALQYDAAVCGKPLALQFTTSHGALPDLHSGYKVFTRRTAADVFLQPPRPAGLSEEAYYRHAVEAVMCVEAIKSGAMLAEVGRSTFDEQPVSAFGSLERVALFRDKILWPCRRLEVPPPFVAQWIDNHLPRLLLGTVVPDGVNEMLELRRRVLEALGQAEEPTRRPEGIVRAPFL